MAQKKLFVTLLIFISAFSENLRAQTVSFNFSSAAQPVAGWTNIYGNPAAIVCSGTSGGITVSSIATGNWAPFSDGNCAFDGGGASGGTFFPAAVMANEWFQYSTYYAQYNALLPQLLISGLNKDSVYTIKMTGSNSLYLNTLHLNPIRYTVTGAIIYGYVDINGENNTNDGAVFHNVAPDAFGTVKVYVNTYNGSNVAGISGLQIIRGHTTALKPTVAFTRPSNNQLLPEDGIVTLAATASETGGGSIARVEFYANEVLLASDSTAPYGYTWANADPGNYVLKARAVDGFGNTAVATINVTVQSLNYFWSTTGNIATGADSSFVGTVDTNDLAFKTNNIERMRILKNGTITIPGTGIDKVNQPALRIYGNGDVAMSSTMDTAANTYLQNGVRYYSKLGLLQIGTTDKLDTTVNKYVYGNYKGSGILINSDEPNIIKGRIYSSYVSGDLNNLDSTAILTWSILTGEEIHVSGWTDHSILAGFGHVVKGSSNSVITGNSNQITKPTLVSLINGFVNSTADSAAGTLVSGAYNQFGGNSQLLVGQFLVNRTPFGATLGNSNVDFSTLPYTGQRGGTALNLNNYPLFVLGNGSDNVGGIRSNAMTVLYNGRTQINTTGFGQTLTQTAVTPKAALDVVSTNTGVLLPRLTNAQRNAIASGDLQNGLLLYNTDSSAFQYYNGSAWNSVGSAVSGASSGRWMYNNGLQYDSINSVAIGTNKVPTGYMLAVKGSGLFTRLQVKSVANWPDYVFEKKYQLRTLEDLETYIDRHKHLPDVASVAKVNAEGVDLGANQAAILKNVEELTLYLIEENKQLKAQGARAVELEKKVADQDARFTELQRQIDALKALLNKTNN